MKNILLALTFGLFSTGLINAQVIHFEENFDSGSSNKFVQVNKINDDGTFTPLGSAPGSCGDIIVGVHSDFISSDVSLNPTQNATSFMGVNPQAPCGGYYFARAKAVGEITFDGGAGTRILSFKYYKSSTIGWEQVKFNIELIGNSETLEITHEDLTTTDEWMMYEFEIPESFGNSINSLYITLGGGEFTGIDDIKILSMQEEVDDTPISLPFNEDFETQSSDYFVHLPGGEDTFEVDIPSGPSPCSSPSIGNYTDFSSASVTLNAADNDGYFLGINPEEPCGGYFQEVCKINRPIDLSTTDETVTISFRYYKSSTIDYGASTLKLELTNADNSITIEDELTITDAWTEFAMDIPSTFGDEITRLYITLGGEAILIDDFRIGEKIITDIEDEIHSTFDIYPNPSKGMIYINTDKSILSCEIFDISGKLIKKYNTIENNSLDLTDMNNGVYIIKTHTESGIQNNRLIIE